MTPVEGPLWRAARLDDLGRVEPEGFWDEWARTPGYGAGWRSVGTRLGIRGFGLNHVRPEVMREATALESPTVVLMVGGTPGQPYKPWDYGKDGA